MTSRRAIPGAVALVLGLAGLVLSPEPAVSGPVQVLVPAYFYPAGAGLQDWNDLAAAASQIGVTAILNPASGPGTAPDPNYVAVVDNLRAAGGSVIGYVYTSYGDESLRPLSAVEADIDAYSSFYNIDGIFLDQMSTDPSRVPYYQALYSYIKAQNSAYSVFGNPGTNTQEVYLTSQTADTFVIYENNDAVSPYSAFTPAPWVFSYDARRHFASIVYNVASEATMIDYVGLAIQKHAGYLYVTDDTLPNPYDSLPSYWDQEVSAISAVVPEPATAVSAWLGVLFLAVIRGRRALSRPRTELESKG